MESYYRSFQIHPHHNYYEGRDQADLTPWLEYFVTLLAEVFQSSQSEALEVAGKGGIVEPDELRRLDRRARSVLALFRKQDKITSGDVAQILGLTDRMSRNLLQQWVKDGWLKKTGPSNRSRAYILSEIYRK